MTRFSSRQAFIDAVREWWPRRWLEDGKPSGEACKLSTIDERISDDGSAIVVAVEFMTPVRAHRLDGEFPISAEDVLAAINAQRMYRA